MDNFSFFLKSNQFATILRNTLLYNIVFIILGIVLPVGLAIMINNIYSKRKSKTYQTMMFLPHFMSWVVISYFVYAFLSPDRGLMNSILQGMGKDPVRWYSEAKYWLCTLPVSPALTPASMRPPCWMAHPRCSRPGTSPCRP